jgi:transposase
MRPTGNPAALEARRKIAARLFAQGKTLTEVAAAVGSSVSSASRWRRVWKRRGESGLAAKAHAGPIPRLTKAQQHSLVTALSRGPQFWGFDRSGWTCALVQQLIVRLFGVSFHVDYVGTLLHRLGWSPQKPQQRARERNELDIERWRRETWPRLKRGLER